MHARVVNKRLNGKTLRNAAKGMKKRRMAARGDGCARVATIQAAGAAIPRSKNQRATR